MADIRASIGLDSKEAEAEIAKLSKNIDGLLSKASKAVKIDVDIDTNTIAGKATDAANAAGKNFKSAFSGVGDALSGAFGGALLGGGLAGAITSGIGLLKDGVTQIIDLGSSFETGLASLSAVTGATGAGLDDLGQRARDLAVQFGGSANDQLTVFQTTLSKIGPQLAQSPDDLAKFAENVNVLGKTDSALGAAGAVDALTGAMLQFGVNVNDSNEVAQESTRFINVLAASAAVGSASVGQVAEAVSVVGATAKNANVSFEETNAALQVLASKSLVGSQAGTGLTTVLNKLQAQSADGDKALKALGTSSAELGNLLNTGGIGPAVGKLREAMAKLGTQAEKNALLNKLFGEGGQNAAAALLGSGEMLDQFTKGVTGTNSATEQAAINMSTLSETWSRAVAGIQDIGIGIYQAVTPVLTTIISLLTNTLGPVLARLKDVFSKAFGNVMTVLKPILAVIGGMIISNIVSTITYVSTVLSTIADVFNRAFDAVKRAVQPLVDTFGQLFGSMSDGIDPVQTFQEVLGGITEVMTEVGKIIGDVAGVIIEFVVTGIQFAVGAINKLVGLFKSQNTETKGVSENTGKATSIMDKLRRVFDNIRGTINGVTFAFREIKMVIMEFFDALTSLDIQKALAAFTGFGERVKKAYDEGFNSVQRQRQEAEVAAQAREREAQAAEAAAAAEEAGAEAGTKKAKAEGTALERAIKLYKEQSAVIEGNAKLQKAEAQALLKQGKLTEEQFKRISAAADADVVLAKYNKAVETFRATINDQGLFVETNIKLNKDESDLEIRTIIAELAASRQYEVPATLKLERDPTPEINRVIARAQQLLKPLAIPVAVDDSLIKTDDIILAAGDAAAGITNAFTDSFTNVTKVNREEINKQVSALKKQLRDGEISYIDYSAKVGELNASIAKDPNRLDVVMEAVNSAVTKTTASIITNLSKSYDALTKKATDGTATIGDAFTLFATQTGLGFAGLVADGQNAFKALLTSALDALQALVPVLVAQITGVNLAATDNILTFGASGIARAVAFTAILQGLVALARNAVAGFAKGGLVTGGEQMIRINEKGPEYVVNDRATKHYKPLLDAMNYGTPMRADIAKKLNLDKLGITFADQTAKGMNAVNIIAAKRDGKQLDTLVAQNKELHQRIDTLTSEVIRLREDKPTTHRTTVTVPINERDLDRRAAQRQVEYVSRW